MDQFSGGRSHSGRRTRRGRHACERQAARAGKPRPWTDFRDPTQAIALWIWLNLETARHGEEHLGNGYLRNRFEDLSAAPAAVAAHAFGFFGLDADPAVAEAEARRPSLSRWRETEPTLVDELSDVAAAALAKFG